MWQQLLGLLSKIPKDELEKELAKADFSGYQSIADDSDLGTAWGGSGLDIGDSNRPWQSENVARPEMPSDRARQMDKEPGKGVDLDLIAGLSSMKRPQGGPDYGQFGMREGGDATSNLMALRKLAGGRQQQQRRPLMSQQPLYQNGLLNHKPQAGQPSLLSVDAWREAREKRNRWRPGSKG